MLGVSRRAAKASAGIRLLEDFTHSAFGREEDTFLETDMNFQTKSVLHQCV